ncbi:MAG TPA: DNA-3-methyladenine glycosylase, partial [Thermoplasmata archaeon]|nr:DNA-3-methyladenine glycosylase [Thermoplasmata archaeon]
MAAIRPSRRALPRSFYDRPAPTVAKELLGAELTHEVGDTVRRIRLVETEAYVQGDAASHSFRGPTARNRSMFHRPGTLYVFRIHQVVCANAVTREGEAVLFRAGEPREGVVGSTSGPGRLCRALGLEIRHDGLDLVHGPVRIAAGPPRAPPVVTG